MRNDSLTRRMRLVATLTCYLAWAAVILYGPSLLQRDEQQFDAWYLSTRGAAERDSQPISSHWRFGLDRTAALDDESRRQRICDEPEPGTQRLTLHPRSVERGSLLLVPRHPTFNVSAVRRQVRAPSRPNGSVLVPGGHGTEVSCLTTDDPSLRTRAWAEFSLEVVVLFLPDPAAAFGLRGVYQTIVGRNGAQLGRSYGRSGFDAKLASLYLKLAPSRRVPLDHVQNERPAPNRHRIAGRWPKPGGCPACYGPDAATARARAPLIWPD